MFKALARNSQIESEVIWEVDSKRIGCPKMVKRLVEKAKNDLVMFLGDDTIPLKGFDTEAFKVMQELEWGLVGLNDMVTPHATHWLAHKRLLDELDGEFFHTGYIHCFCDNELRERAIKIGRYKWAEKAKIMHCNPIHGKIAWDDDYKRVYSKEAWDYDFNLYKERKNRFAF